MVEDNLAIARRYLQTIERGATGEELAAFFTSDVVQEEFPNKLTPNGARRGLAEILDAATRGQKVMRAQRYDIVSAISSGDSVALEIRWSGTLAVAFGSIPAGGEMHARLAVFIDFREGRIARQRNYDSFEPW